MAVSGPPPSRLTIQAPRWAPAQWPHRVLGGRLRSGTGCGGREAEAGCLGLRVPMSALRRSGYGFSDGQSYGRYYGAGGGDVPDHTPPALYSSRPEPPQTPVSWRARGGGPGETTWSGEGGGVSDGYYRVQLERPGGSHQVSFAPSAPEGVELGGVVRGGGC